MRNDVSSSRLSRRFAAMAQLAALSALLIGLASDVSNSQARSDAALAAAASDKAEKAPDAAAGAAAAPGSASAAQKPVAGPIINLYPMHSTWPKAPYPVPLRKPHYESYDAPRYEGPRRPYSQPYGYARQDDYPVYPKERSYKRYAEPTEYGPKRDYAPDRDYAPGPRYEKSYGYSKPPRYPEHYAADESYGRAEKPYRGEPHHGGGPAYPEKDDYPKHAGGGYNGGYDRYEPELPLAPDFELNRHRGFGRLFPVLDPYKPGGYGLPAQGSKLSALHALGQVLKESGHPDDPAGDSDMPAGYTFLAQFIDHDLTLDISTSLAKGIRGDEVKNTRTPDLDLDNVYAGGPLASPFIYKLPYLRTGRLLAGEGAYVRHDLLRADYKDQPGPPGGQATALIGDPRNDENLIVSQLHAAFIAFHNRTVDLLVLRRYGRQRYRYCGYHVCSIYRLADSLPPAAKLEIFETARNHVLYYYHRVIAEDYLPRLIGEERVVSIFKDGRRFFFPRGFHGKDGRFKDPYIPVEFAVGAFRYGHSQVRSSYQIREGYRISLFRGHGGSGLQAFHPVSRQHLIDWRYFFDIDRAPPRGFNYARRLDPLVTPSLHSLGRTNVVSPHELGSLPARNLIRGRVFYLPSGQAVAERVLPVIGAHGGYGRGPRDKGGYDGGAYGSVLPPNDRVRYFLGREETPLWFYVLQEAEIYGISRQIYASPAYAHSYGPRIRRTPYERVSYNGFSGKGGHGEGGHSLGPVGGTLVGEVLIGLMEHYREKTGKGLSFRPEVHGSTSGLADQYGKADRPRYLMRNLLLDAGVVDIY